MKTITMDVLKDAANRLLFDMSDEQYKTLYEEFQILTKQMETIGKIEGLEKLCPDDFPLRLQHDLLTGRRRREAFATRRCA
jgi:hypothetical protein